MFRNLFIIIAMLILIGVTPSSSQESTPQTPDNKEQESKSNPATKSSAPDLSLEQVLENYYKAIGGLQNWRDINTMKMAGVMISMGQKVPVRATYMRPNKCRVEFKVKDTVIVQAYDGEAGWQHNPHGEVIIPKPMGEDRSNYLHDTCDIDGPLNDYIKKGNKIDFLGTEALYGNDTYKLRIKHDTGNVQTYYLDTKTFLPIRLDGVYQLDGREHKVTTSFFNYRKIGKVTIPYKIDFDITGSLGTEQMIFRTVQINPRVNESYFKKPD